MGQSLKEQAEALTPAARDKAFANMDPLLAEELLTTPWWYASRPEQQTPEGQWAIWLILAGRGWGKTRTGAEWLVQQVLDFPRGPDGTPTEWAIVGETFGDVKNVCVEGPSGIQNILSRRGMTKGEHYYYNRSSWQLTFPDGQRVHMLSADDSDSGRGYNLAGVWADEIAKWRYPYATWTEGIAPALRIGQNPQAVITTTPKPSRLLQEWVARDDGSIYLTRGSTFDNAANLSPAALLELNARYKGTRLGRQELYAEILEPEGSTLRPEWFKIVEMAPASNVRIRMWDLAATEPSDTNPDPDWSVGFLVGKSDDGYTVFHGQRFRSSPAQVERMIVETAQMDGPEVAIWIEQEPGASGKSVIAHYARLLEGTHRVRGYRPSGDKNTRANVLVAGPAEQGRITLVRGNYLQAFLDECSQFPDGDHDDQVDVLSAAIDVLSVDASNAALVSPLSGSEPSGWRM